jgi:diaminopimelate decarboxylase
MSSHINSLNESIDYQAGKKTTNQEIMPTSARIDADNRLSLGGIDAEELLKKFGSPLWVVCQETIEQAAQAINEGLKSYPHPLPCYAGKAFLCLAMAKLMEKAGFGLDVVSEGELYTALEANFPTGKIYLHGNNKSDEELRLAITSGGKHDHGTATETQVKIVIDNEEEILRVNKIAQAAKKIVPVLLRIIPGIEIDTHDHIKTGHETSKFGIALDYLPRAIETCRQAKNLKLLGLHAHIGSQAMETQPYIDTVRLMASLYKGYQDKYGTALAHLDVGGGIGIAYTEEDNPINLTVWSQIIAQSVKAEFEVLNLALPELSIEPGRAIIGTAGVTLYKIGNLKSLPDGTNYLSVDGGMADNPRPITYQAKYKCAVANRMEGRKEHQKNWSVVGRFCESGDIIVEEALLDAQTGDTLCVFCTGAYHYSQASNYNRTAKPACVLVKQGKAELIIARQSLQDLIQHDRLPDWLKSN